MSEIFAVYAYSFYYAVCRSIHIWPEHEEPGGIVKGKVATTDNMPAAGVTVTIKNLNRNAITDEQGDFIFHHVKAGSYEIEISVIGYQTIRRSLVVENDRTTDLSIQIEISAKELQEVVVNSSRTPNERKLTVGKADILARDLPQAITVIDKEMMDQQQVLTMGDALMHVNGVYDGGHGWNAAGDRCEGLCV